jgi:hypothetical protein
MDASNFHLKQFKIHDFNAKSIKAITKEADRLRADFELESCIATISGLKQKQSLEMERYCVGKVRRQFHRFEILDVEMVSSYDPLFWALI